LALSSRNARLTATDRERALTIPRALERVIRSAAAGESDVVRLQKEGLAVLKAPGVTVDYLAIVDGDTLEPLDQLQPGARLLIAAEVGGIRLIDNAAIGPELTAPRED
jgi:pantoate--beta-alanine ligase